MATVGKRFKKLLSNIQLTKIQLEDAITKHHGVRKTLHEAYYSTVYRTKSLKELVHENLDFGFYKSKVVRAYVEGGSLLDEGYVFNSSLLVGSYGKNTAIRPPSDIDILFQIPISEFDRYNSYSSNGQSQLLQDVKKKLQTKYPITNIRADGQIVSVPFSSYKIEVLPAFKLTDGKYLFPNTHGGGSWEYTNPKAEIKNISDSNKTTNGNTVKLIKMIKAWKKYCSVPIGSLVIELRVVNFLKSWEHSNKSEIYFDWMIRDFFSELVAFVNGSCQIPGIDEKKFYGNEWKSKAQTALNRSKKACEFEAQKFPHLASNEWKKIFGNDFEYLV